MSSKSRREETKQTVLKSSFVIRYPGGSSSMAHDAPLRLARPFSSKTTMTSTAHLDRSETSSETDTLTLSCEDISIDSLIDATPQEPVPNDKRLIVFFDLSDTLQTTRPNAFGRFRPQLKKFLAALYSANIDVRVFIRDGNYAHHSQINAYLSSLKSDECDECEVSLPFFPALDDVAFQLLQDEALSAQYREYRDYCAQTSSTKRLWMHKACVHRVDYADVLHKRLPLSEDEMERTVLVDDEVFGMSRYYFGRIVPSLKRNEGAANEVRPQDDFAAYMLDWECGLLGRVLPALLRMQRDLQRRLSAEEMESTTRFAVDEGVAVLLAWVEREKESGTRASSRSTATAISLDACHELIGALLPCHKMLCDNEREARERQEAANWLWRWTLWAFDGCLSPDELLLPLVSNRGALYKPTAVFRNPFHFRM